MSEIDPLSLLLHLLVVDPDDPATLPEELVAPVRWAYEDVATPYDPQDCMDECCEEECCIFACTEEGPDGYLDLTLKFDTQEVIAAIGWVSARAGVGGGNST